MLRQLFERLGWIEGEKRIEATVNVYEWTVEHTNGDVERYCGHEKRTKGVFDTFLVFYTYNEERLESRALLEEVSLHHLDLYNRLKTGARSKTEIGSVKEVTDKILIGVDRVVVRYDSIDHEIIDSHITYANQYPELQRD